jgi:Flp pilus assembly protein TadG
MIRKRGHTSGRQGTILSLVAVSLVGLFGFVALAVDIGTVATARTQCQNAADAAAMAGARTLTGSGSSDNNAGAAAVNAANTATANSVLSKALTSSQVVVQIGPYAYNSATHSFPSAPFSNLVTVAPGSSPGPGSPNPWSLVQATINYQGQYSFAQIFGLSSFNIQTVAAAAHRPRDIAVILDFSGSMRFASLPGVPYYGTRDITGAGNPANPGSNNPDPVFPLFGGYSAQATAGLQNTSDVTIGNWRYGVSNLTTTTTDGRPPIVPDFYQNNGGTAAFTSAGSDNNKNYAASSPGDPYLYVNNASSGNYAQTVADITGSSAQNANWESKGYKYYTNQTFNGYTRGPNYWGKTFFIWPPDPTKDWRQLYFGTNNNTALWTSSGDWQDPKTGGYAINYNAILNWIVNTGPNPFPAQLQSGRLVYYTQIPATINTSTFPPTDLNQRFWKDYIDYVLGLVQLDANTWEVTTGNDVSQYGTVTGLTGYGGDFTWGTVQAKAKPNGKYMSYTDNPKRPRLHFWFGPMTMIDFLGCYNLWYDVSPACSRFCWWPGTCHESPLYACKLGIEAALNDINNNHPNDYVSLIYYSVPMGSANDPGNRFNRVRAPLGLNYKRMSDALWYPLYTIENPGTTVGPYDTSNNLETPRAMGGTCFSMPLMLAYNQFSANSSLVNYNPSPAPAGDAGGLGRQGAQKVVVFETDGLPNTTATANLQNNGAYSSYYSVRYNSSNPSASDFPTGVNGYGDNDPTVTSQIYNTCSQICALDSANPPGYSTTRKPVLIHCIGFGPVYDVGAPERASALATLQQIQYIGSTQSSPSTALQSYKIIDGTQNQIIQNLQQAFTLILQGGVQVSMLQ